MFNSDDLLEALNNPKAEPEIGRPESRNSESITFSKNVFIPVTNACRNICSYCNFRSSNPSIMDRRAVAKVLESGREHGCKEALFTFGERPEDVEKIKDNLTDWGYSSSTDYLLDLCEDAIGYGMLPHSNIGVVTKKELSSLKEVNASLGLMLESSSDRLCEKGMPHELSPGKRPRLRLDYIENAGKLQIPFTTGLLIGIGESNEEIIESLEALKKLHDRYGHIQELIIQNFVPHRGTKMGKVEGPSTAKMLNVVEASKMVLPEVSIQVPPNLNPEWQSFIQIGVNDLGGISPVTEDYINPGHSWPVLDVVKSSIQMMGLNLRERLPIYPGYIKRRWYSDKMASLIEVYTDDDGLVKEVHAN